MAKSQYVWHRNVPHSFARTVARAAFTGRGQWGVSLSIRCCVTKAPTQTVRPNDTIGSATPSTNHTG